MFADVYREIMHISR